MFFIKLLFGHSLVSSDTETYELVDKMKTLEDLTSTVQEREGIIQLLKMYNILYCVLCSY